MSDSDQAATAAQAEAFGGLGLGERVLAQVATMSFDAPTEVQRRLIPAITGGRDALVRARSGEGKTNAYILPIVDRLRADAGLQALVVVPTRAIAMRMQRNFARYTDAMGLRAELERARDGRRPRRDHPPADSQPEAPAAAEPPPGLPHVLLATPQHAREVLERNPAERADLSIVVIDELDAMLDMGGAEAVEQLLDAVQGKQVVLIAGELGDDVRDVSARRQRDPVTIDPPPGEPVPQRVEHVCFRIDEEDPFDALVSFCKQKKPRLALVYAEDPPHADALLDRLARVRVEARALRERGRRAPRGRGADSSVIVAVEPGTRQLSTMPFSHVLHFAPPSSAAAYQQRLEHCDRLNRRGQSILLLESDHPLVGEIEAALGLTVQWLDPLPRPEHARGRGRSRDERGRRDGARSGRDGAAARSGRDGARGGRGPGGDRRDGAPSFERESRDQQPPAQAPGASPPDTPPGNATPKPPKTLGSRFKPRGRTRRMWSRD